MEIVTLASLAQVTHQSGVHPELLAQHPFLQEPKAFSSQCKCAADEQSRSCLADLWDHPMEAMEQQPIQMDSVPALSLFPGWGFACDA